LKDMARTIARARAIDRVSAFKSYYSCVAIEDERNRFSPAA